MSRIACIEPRIDGSFDKGNIIRVYPWRVGADGIEIRSGGPGHNDGWVDAVNPIINKEDPSQNDKTFFMYLFTEIEDSVGDDLQSYTGKKRGRLNIESKFPDPAFRAKLLDTSKHVPVQMGKGIKKSDIAKGPDWGNPRNP